jgi:hypothetical protein
MMMRHSRNRFVSGFLVALTLFPWLSACATPGTPMFVEMRSHPANAELIRERLLKETPLNSSRQLVLDFCASKRLKCEIDDGRGFYRSGEKTPVGVKSIQVHLDDYLSKDLNVSIDGFWGFDIDGKLVDIWVWDTYDGP